MEKRVKERLTGAIILVAAAVVLVPEMFSGHRDTATATTGAPPRPATEGPPLRSYTMERDAKAPAASAPQPPPTGKVAADAQGTAVPAAPEPPESQAPASPAPASPQPASPAKLPAVADDGTTYFVQVGSFSRPDNAQRYAQEISRKGFAARVDPGRNDLLRVRVGPVAGRAAALELKARLAAQGYQGALTSP